MSFEEHIVFHSVLCIKSLALLKSAWAYCHIVLVFWQYRSSGALGFQFTLILRPLWSESAMWGITQQSKSWLGEDMKARSMSAGLPHGLTWVQPFTTCVKLKSWEMLQSFEYKWWEGSLKLILKCPRKIKLQNCVIVMFSKISKSIKNKWRSTGWFIKKSNSNFKNYCV